MDSSIEVASAIAFCV